MEMQTLVPLLVDRKRNPSGKIPSATVHRQLSPKV